MDSWEGVVRKVSQLTRAATIVGVPVVVTEQYKKGLGETSPEVLREIGAPVILEKEHFSACLEQDFLPVLHAFRRENIVVAGMETHVCVLQTCLDLIAAGFRVHVVADAVASRTGEDRDIALALLRQAGAVVSSAEAIIFQWVCRANTELFRKVLPLVK
jgi:nicotinamidase-related amidase